MRYAFARLVQAVVVVFIVTVAVFFALRLSGGDPAKIRGGVFTQNDDILEEYRRQFGTDQSLFVQFGKFLQGLVQGDLGNSFRFERPVVELILPALGHTLLLGGIALALTFVVATVMGLLAAANPRGVVARAASVIATIGQSAPAFWVGLLLISFFAIGLSWFPPGGLDGWTSLVLPSVALSLSILPAQMRVLATSARHELNEDYVRTAHAFGLPARKINFVYVYRNAVLPLMTVIGNDMGALLGGVIVIEVVFNYPGIGGLALTALSARDFPLIQGVAVFAASAFVLVNLAVDLLYVVINPRVRVGGAAT